MFARPLMPIVLIWLPYIARRAQKTLKPVFILFNERLLIVFPEAPHSLLNFFQADMWQLGPFRPRYLQRALN